MVAAGLPADRIHVVPPSSTAWTRPSARPPWDGPCFLPGGWSGPKGIFDLLEALAMAEEQPRLVVAGVGTVEDEIAARVRELGLAERIEFTGWLDHAAMAARFRQARMVVMPSRWQEPFGIVGLEALALGRPGGGLRRRRRPGLADGRAYRPDHSAGQRPGPGLQHQRPDEGPGNGHGHGPGRMGRGAESLHPPGRHRGHGPGL